VGSSLLDSPDLGIPSGAVVEFVTGDEIADVVSEALDTLSALPIVRQYLYTKLACCHNRTQVTTFF
jgi:hypothetical protein